MSEGGANRAQMSMVLNIDIAVSETGVSVSMSKVYVIVTLTKKLSHAERSTLIGFVCISAMKDAQCV